MENPIYEIFLDDKKFIISYNLLKSNPDFLLSKILFDKFTNPSIIVLGQTIFIDRDPYLFSYVLKKLRGYNIKYESDELENISQEFKFYGLDSAISVQNPLSLINQLSTNPQIQEIIKLNYPNTISDSDEELPISLSEEN